MSPLSNHDSSERQTAQSRRRFLFGIGAATAALAGCASSDDSDDDEPADDSNTDSFDPVSDLSYGQWLTTAADGMLFAYANLEAAPANDESGGSLDESLTDPLATYPLVMSQTIVGLGQLRLSFAGLTQALTPEAESESTVNEVVVINQTTVAQGTFATDRLDELLTDTGGCKKLKNFGPTGARISLRIYSHQYEQTDETWGIAYEQTQTLNGYDQYEPAEVPDSFDSEPPVIAVADESVVVSAGVERLERMVTAGDDGQPRIYETNDTVTQLLEQAGTGDFVVGEIGTLPDDTFNSEEMFETDPQFEPQSGEDVVAAVDFGDDSETVESQFALAAEDIDESRKETVETTFGTAAVDDSVSIDVSGSRITASGTYTIESVGLTGGDSSEQEELSQTEAAELVPPDSLAFQYEPQLDQQFGELWVEVTEETNAAAIRLETDSGNYTEIRPQERSVGAGDNIAVQVDPQGDSVTVFVINNEGAVGELTTQSVPTESLSETAASQAVPIDALSFNYSSPDADNLGSLTVEVVADIEAETLIAQPQEGPSVFTDRVGSLDTGDSIDIGTTLETAVEPEGDEVIVYATVNNATGEVARWQGPD